jgi:hypothetical protein
VSGPGPGGSWRRPTSEDPGPKGPWWRRRSVLLGAAGLAVIAIAVITDLPTPTSPTSDAKAESTIIGEVNTDVAPCVYAVHEAMLIYVDRVSGQLNSADRAQVPSLIRDDEDACSLTDSSVFDLSDIDVIGSPAGKQISDAISTSTVWVTSDALGVIDLIETLQQHPHDQRAQAQLTVDRQRMTEDRARVDAEVASASRLLNRTLPNVHLATGTLPAPGQEF